MNATKGEKNPARERPSSVSAVADWNVVTSSQANMPTMIAMRTIAARRRSSTHAPTVYMPMNSDDVADVHLGDVERHRHEERQRADDRRRPRGSAAAPRAER